MIFQRKVACFVGTRPEAIKMVPVVRELQRHSDAFSVQLCSTGQHRQMLDSVLGDFSMKPDVDMNVMRTAQTLGGLSGHLFASIDQYLGETMPDWVLIQGDTTTAMVASMCAFYRRIKVGHVEAGLRTLDRNAPFPEEVNRRIISLATDVHFAPTKISSENLYAEGVSRDAVVVTGNTVVDALMWMVNEVRTSNPMLPELVECAIRETRRIILITGHRRENFGDGFKQMCEAIGELSMRFPEDRFVYPVHLNPNVQEPVNAILGAAPGVILISPLGYKAFVHLMDHAHLILTDSGGIQEEAPSLGKPVIIMRDVTERPEGVLAGVSRLVGARRDQIVATVTNVLHDSGEYQKMSGIPNPYGDGQSSVRIVQALRER